MTQTRHHSGLTDAQVLESRALHGPNVLTPPHKETLWEKFRTVCKHRISLSLCGLVLICTIAAALLTSSMGAAIWVMPGMLLFASLLIIVVGFFGGFNDPLFQILIVAFILSMGISIYEYEWHHAGFSTFFEPIGIIVALFLATGVAYFLERSNEKTFQSLNEVNDDTLVKVIRNDNVTQICRRDIVVGDIVILESGEEVPADCLLLEALNLRINESTLTGEPSVTKTTDSLLFDKEATYPSNHILKGTTLMEGYCVAEVLRVGDATESGKVFQAAQVDEGDPTPLTLKLNSLAKLITTTSYVIGVLVIMGRILMYFVMDEAVLNSPEAWIDFVSYVLNTIMIAVTLIVVAVPEGLPMSVTLSLAFSMRKLMRENTLPRTMHACETMGAISVICTDKTGTLTKNQMQVGETCLAENDIELMAEMIALNTTANLNRTDEHKIQAIGNPTEGALLLWLQNQDIDYLPMRECTRIVERLPFSTENKYMATVVESQVKHCPMLYVKGAPEIVMDFCNLADDEKKKYNDILLTYQQKGMRTLGFAFTEINTSESPFDRGKLNLSHKLRMAGIMAISDPIRDEVPAAINDCIQAGINIKIVTGDTSGTAIEIACQAGIWNTKDCERQILTGTEFAQMSDSDIMERLTDLKILSRARPADKERLVRLLKQQGHVVAVTGDGTNDAPALNAAHVGLSMGDGTAVAKEASDMTILDNSFSTISNAVMWGRSLYKNIQRFVMFQMTINVAACLIVLMGAFVGTESPLTVTQMLWVNLIMDTFAAIALASLPPSRSVMKDRPRLATDPIITRPMAWNIFGVGSIFTILLMAWLLYLQHNDVQSLNSLTWSWSHYNGLTAYELTLFFTVFVILQFWNMFNTKAFMTGHSAFARIRECRGFIAIALVIVVGQMLIVECGGQMFNVCGLKFGDWAIILTFTSPVLIAGECYRLLHRKV